MSSQCSRCKKNLVQHRHRYEWLIARGWSQKDAASEVLQAPSISIPIKSCCINELHTSVDTEKDILERYDIQAAAKDKRIARERLAGIPEPRRETVKIYCKDDSGQLGGYFVLLDAPFADPKILGKPFQQSGKGFEITNIALLPKEMVDREQFRWSEDERPLCLWSGNMKIVPVIHIGDVLRPAVLYVERIVYVTEPSMIMGQPPTVVETKDPQILSERIDRTLINAEIKYYDVGVLDNVIPGGTIQMPHHIITVLKQLPKAK